MKRVRASKTIIKSNTRDTRFLSRGSATSWCPNGRGLHSTPFKWSNDRLEYHGVGVSRPGVPRADEWVSPRGPAQMGQARGRARRGERSEAAGDRRERWESRGLRVCPAPRSGALAVGGYKRPRGRGKRAAPRERLSHPRPRAANLL
jgi:hypothetical protein